jgi:N-acetylglucosaminyldiphosphoundecaprenol N-acetyl-beta-D-mannosaminyltransferase
MKKINILDIEIDSLTIDELQQVITQSVATRSKLTIATVNNEFVVESQINKAFKSVLDSFSLRTPDSAGIVWASRVLAKVRIQRITGVDLAYKICQLSSQTDIKIFFLGGAKGVGTVAKDEILKEFPKANICGVIDGVDISADQEAPYIIDQINSSKANVVFVCLGSPKQELWIHQNLNKLDASVFIGLGGTLDYFSKKIKRAPRWMRELGLEWLYRLISQPQRYRRIFKATISFPLLVIKRKMTLTKSRN